MKDFKKLQQICLEEVKAAGITPGNITRWVKNGRFKRKIGQCRIYSQDQHCEIHIASIVLEDERISEEVCKQIMIHEILHSCPECGTTHTGKWKEYVDIINKKYGYNIRRTITDEELGVPSGDTKVRGVKYVYLCKGCGNRIELKRKCNFMTRPWEYRCGKCKIAGQFERIQ